MYSNRPYNKEELEKHEALVDEEIRRYLDQHSGDAFDSNSESVV